MALIYQEGFAFSTLAHQDLCLKRIARNARSIGIKGLKQWNPHTISEDPKDIKRIFERNEQIRDYEGASSLKEDAEPNPERSS